MQLINISAFFIKQFSWTN